MPKIADALVAFTPERWGEVARFRHFYDHTYKFSDRERRALAGAENHFEKALVLIKLAERLRPNLEIDRDQLETGGYTPAVNAREIATVIEAAILEFYSTVDCAVKVMRAVYGPKTRGFKDSTRKVFQAPHSITGDFPEAIREAIAGAGWYWRLLHLRDELVHYAPGHIHQDHQTHAIRYDHYGLKEGGKDLSIEDIYGWLSTTTAQLNAFLGTIFHHFNATLVDKESFEMCGMVQGRVLHRYVSPVGELTFNNGRCGAWVWFEKPEFPTCPFVEHCGAYQRKAPVPDGDPPQYLDPDPQEA
jgi:hypothetical protein